MKKNTNSTPATAPAEKKRVVVVKKKSPQSQGSTNPTQKGTAEQPKKDVHVVVKKAESQTAEKKENKEGGAKASQDLQGTAQKTEAAAKTEQKVRTFELNPSRPNVKAGNLSDKGRQNNNRNGGFASRGNQNGRPFNKDGSGSSFTGAQARQGYQNREKDANVIKAII